MVLRWDDLSDEMQCNPRVQYVMNFFLIGKLKDSTVYVFSLHL